MTQRTITLIVVVWALGILSLLGIASVNQIKPFDPSMLLAQAASDPQFDSDFTQALTQAGVAPGTLVHMVSNGDCYCDQLTESHRQELSGELASAGYRLQQLSLAEHPDLSRYLDHYPALAVIDGAGQLRYLGPYAIGYGCFTGKNLVAQIKQAATSAEYYGASINSDVKGCFCAV
ncbi:MAG: DUF6436 domain-containing protein [Pseudomonadota bacterium]|nr:DUF6436 domain-containing protein [Pseudomonadota bacterium]